jgi:hypothetical protein
MLGRLQGFGKKTDKAAKKSLFDTRFLSGSEKFPQRHCKREMHPV